MIDTKAGTQSESYIDEFVTNYEKNFEFKITYNKLL